MIDPAFELALRSAEPAAQLRQLATDELGKGRTREDVLARFEKARQALRAADREDDEDIILDVMDALVGWCSPHRKIPSAGPSAGSVNGTVAGDVPAPEKAD
jgi:hypothetical protein